MREVVHPYRRQEKKKSIESTLINICVKSKMQSVPLLLAIIFAIGIISVAANYGYIPILGPVQGPVSPIEGFGSGSGSATECKQDPVKKEIGQPLITIVPVNAPQDDTVSHLLHRTKFQSTPQMSSTKTAQQLYVQQPALMYDGIWTRTGVDQVGLDPKQVRSDWTIIREELLYPTNTSAIGRVFPANDYHRTVDQTMTVPPYISQPTWAAPKGRRRSTEGRVPGPGSRACGEQLTSVVETSSGNDINGL